METQPDTIEPERTMNENMLVAAKTYLKLGYSPIPLVGGTKKAAIKWKPYQSRAPTEDELVEWFSAGEPNVALVTGNGVVVVDVDDPLLLDQVLERCGDTPMRCATPTPGHTHLYYRMRAGVRYGNAVHANGRDLDLRCEGGYAVTAWSRNAEGTPYRWLGEVLPAEELPLVKIKWLRDRKPKRVIQPIEISGNLDEMVRRARAYLARVEGAISGQRGHDTAMRAAGILCQKFGLSIEQALPLFMEWSETSCEPPWTEREAIHKLQDAVRLRASRGLRRIT